MSATGARTTQGRRETDGEVKKIRVSAGSGPNSPEVQRALDELKKGRTVILAPMMHEAPPGVESIAEQPRNLQRFSNWVTVITGGVTLGLGSLAINPKSVLSAAVAAVAGAVLARKATKLEQPGEQFH
jgi:hypothetical protein